MRNMVPESAVLVPDHAECQFKGVIYEIYQWEENMFDGSKEIFEMLKRPDTVEVLVVDDNKILVQYQEQPHYGEFTSFPGGRHDYEGDSELDAAKRELREDSGYICSKWNLIEAIQPNTKIEQVVYTFLASGIEEQVSMSLDSGEKIENRWVTLKEFLELITETTFRSQSKKFLKNINEINNLLALSSIHNYESS